MSNLFSIQIAFLDMKKHIFLISLIFIGSVVYSQVAVDLKLGVSPWRLSHNFDDLSSPVSLGYSGGLNVEYILGGSSVGFLTGIDYLYSQPGTEYIELSDLGNPLAVIYAEKLNRSYIEIDRHEISLPLVATFYHNGLRSGIGGVFSLYLCEDNSKVLGYRSLADYGLTAFTGSRISKRLTLSIGYYYGLNKVLNIDASSEVPDGGQALLGNMQQLKIHLGISLFNNIDNSDYFLSGN